MQDFDFDEIDKAVSSTMGPEPKTDDSSDSTSVPVSNSSPSRSESSPAAKRSSGRFMDVVHPSSDMRSSSPSERSEPRGEPERSEPKPAEEPDSKNTDWPDPLDFHGYKDDTDVKEETPAEEPKPVDEPARPLESPFLSGTKVEKRPLGAFSDTAAADAPEEEETPLLEAPDTELIEATSEDEPAVEEVPVSPPETPPVVEEEPTNIPSSITQQYKEQPSTTDQPTGAIFDTESYHQALTHTPPKKSGALVVVWIVALILVGAGAGAAVYFFVLPLL